MAKTIRNSFNICIIVILVFASSHAQILNGGFENWNNGEPANWITNNINEEGVEKLFFITQTSDAHTGNYALKGEVLGDPSQNATAEPFLISGTQNQAYFSFQWETKTN